MYFRLVLLAILGLTMTAKAQNGVVAEQPDMRPYAIDAVKVGWRYFREGDYDSALRRFRIAIQHDANSAPGYYGIASVYNVQGNFDEAIKSYREALKRDPLHADTYADLGYALMEKHQFPEALQMLDKAIELDPNCGQAYLHYANYYALKQDWKNVGESVNKAVKCGKKVRPELRKTLEEHGVKIDGT